MTHTEIELLGRWQKEIETIDKHLKSIVRGAEWKGNGSQELWVRFPNGGDSINVGEIPELKDKLMRIILDYYEEYLERIENRRDELVICKGERKNQYNPIEIA